VLVDGRAAHRRAIHPDASALKVREQRSRRESASSRPARHQTRAGDAEWPSWLRREEPAGDPDPYKVTPRGRPTRTDARTPQVAGDAARAQPRGQRGSAAKRRQSSTPGGSGRIQVGRENSKPAKMKQGHGPRGDDSERSVVQQKPASEWLWRCIIDHVRENLCGRSCGGAVGEGAATPRVAAPGGRRAEHQQRLDGSGVTRDGMVRSISAKKHTITDND